MSNPERCPNCNSDRKHIFRNPKCISDGYHHPWHDSQPVAAPKVKGHEPDCPCYGDRDEHSKECRHCTCEYWKSAKWRKS